MRRALGAEAPLARGARAARAGVRGDDAIADGEALDALAERVDHADAFVPERSGGSPIRA